MPPAVSVSLMMKNGAVVSPSAAGFPVADLVQGMGELAQLVVSTSTRMGSASSTSCMQ